MSNKEEFEKKCMSLNFEIAQKWFELGRIYGVTDITAAIKAYSESIKFFENPNAYNARAICKQKLSDHNAALEDFNKALELSPCKPNILYGRGFCRLMLKDQRGLADLEKAANLGFQPAFKFMQRMICMYFSITLN